MTKNEFLEGVDNWSNHRHLLWAALEATNNPKNNYPVLELGCGKGSTPFLRKYCEDNRRQFVSFDSNPTYAQEFDSIFTPDWNPMDWFYERQYSVVLIDEAPGEHRKVALDLFARHPSRSDIIIIHDSEPPGWNASDYQVRPLFHNFRYVKDFEGEPGGAWATALSRYYDVTQFEI